jgi:hypothetical protein
MSREAVSGACKAIEYDRLEFGGGDRGVRRRRFGDNVAAGGAGSGGNSIGSGGSASNGGSTTSGGAASGGNAGSGGETSWLQFWSIRQKARQCGQISISQHFDASKAAGMTLGKLLEAKILVEVGGGRGNIGFPTAIVTAQ